MRLFSNTCAKASAGVRSAVKFIIYRFIGREDADLVLPVESNSLEVGNMKLLSVTTTLSPGSAALIRMTGTVEKQSGERFDIWFEVPIGLGDQLSNSGNPWLVAMLPYGMETGETIVCDSGRCDCKS